jgi:hypothetical protein
VVLTLYAALLALDAQRSNRGRVAAAAAAGFFAVGAATAHEDLLLLVTGAGAVGAIFVIGEARRRGEPWLAPLAALALAVATGFAVGVATAILLTGIGPQRFWADLLRFHAVMSGNTAQRTDGSLLRFAGLVPVRVLGELAVNLLGLPMAGLSAIVVVAAPLRWLRTRDRRFGETVFLLGAAAFYLVTFILGARVYLEGDYARILLPLLGPILVFALAGGATLGADRLARALGPGTAPGIATLLCLALAAASLLLYPAPLQAGRSPHRVLYEASKDLVGPDRRLLLPACYGVYRRWVGVGSPVYLGEDAIPLRRVDPWRALDRLVADDKIKYVLVLSDYGFRRLAEPDEIRHLFSVFYGTSLPSEVERSLTPADAIRRPAAWWLPHAAEAVYPGDTRVQWSTALCAFEGTRLTEWLTAKGATLARQVAGIGDIYALP